MSDDPNAELGAYLSATEAEALASLIEAGQHVALAVRAVNPARRERTAQLLDRAGLSHLDAARSSAVLRAVAGAKSVHRDLIPVWTLPGDQAGLGHLTGEFHRLVGAARQSITCATYNFEPSSRMWTVLREASESPGVQVTVYADADATAPPAIPHQMPRTSMAAPAIKPQQRRAVLYTSTTGPDGQRYVSHAKFVIIDHELLLLTSANFSWSAENRNIEFGLLIRDSALARSVESVMAANQSRWYELA